MRDHFRIWREVTILSVGAPQLPVNPGIEPHCRAFSLRQIFRLRRAAVKKPGNLFDVLLRTAMAAAIKPVLPAYFLHARWHHASVDTLHEVMIDSIANQPLPPALSKALDKTLCIRLLRISEYHAVTGFDVDDQQHMLALDADGVHQPLLGRAVRFVVLNNRRRRLGIHRRDCFALVDAAEKLAGGFGAIEDQYRSSLLVFWRRLSVLANDFFDPLKFIRSALYIGNQTQGTFAEG